MLAPVVSVVIPAYNAARFLPETLESVLAQTFAAWEAIVVDDGSTDNTCEVVAQFADQRVKYIFQENRGLSGARNTGIRAAQGEFIGLLDADDRWESEFLARMVAQLNADPVAVAVYCGYRYMNGEGKPLPEIVSRVVSPENLYTELIRGNFVISNAVLARKAQYVEAGLFDESLHTGEDIDMWLRLSKQHRFVGIPDVLAWYRRHDTAMSTDVHWMFTAYEAMTRKHFGLPEGSPDGWSAHKRAAYVTLYLYATEGHLRCGEKMRSAQYLKQVLELSPDLAQSPQLFHRLATAHRPLDKIGDLMAINLDRARQDVVESLDRVFQDSNVDNPVRSVKSAAYGHGYFVLGQLHAWRGHYDEARNYLAKAIQYYPALLLETSVWRVLASTMPGAGLVRRLRSCVRRMSSSKVLL